MSKSMVALVVIASTLLLLLMAAPCASAARHTPRQCDPRLDVQVSQSASGAPQLDGTRQFDVVITNAWRGPVRDVHLNCGYRFRTVRNVDPAMLVQVGPADCPLIDGGAIAPGGRVSFSYFSYVRYTMDVVGATCAARRP
ncbi:hypothetical protein QOZ80_9BG0708110 [Eleusine coracana subsp. coracana]|nr:hypothetical protein QOZ80_9BG0708110 [Eleusine coracana subsp. coracana]